MDPVFIILGLVGSVFLIGELFNNNDDDATPREPDTQEPVVQFGTAEDDTVQLGDGADFYNGLLGNDSINGGGGFDSISGGGGDDIIEGEAGFDSLFGGAGADSIDGGLGKDFIRGGNGTDILNGGGWDDEIYGDDGFDDLFGGSGNDSLYGGEGKDLLVGGTGNDILEGGGWNDGLFGGGGDDQLDGGSSNDLLVGGAGNDVGMGGSGNDDVYGGSGSDTVMGGDGNDVVVGSSLFSRDLSEADYQSVRADTVTRDDDGNIIFAGYGLSGADADASTDTLFGGDGDDLLLIGQNDIATGGDGADDFIIGDWITGPDAAAEITDFDSGEDVIVVFLKSDNADANITVRGDAENSDVREILIDGRVIATVRGSFDPVDGLDADVLTSIYTPV